jgi:hypothetical protein
MGLRNSEFKHNFYNVVMISVDRARRFAAGGIQVTFLAAKRK